MPDFFVTFGQRYAREPHPTLPEAHPDGWVAVEAPDEEAARARAFAHLGPAWAFLYPADQFERQIYPRGQLVRIAAPPVPAVPAPLPEPDPPQAPPKLTVSGEWLVYEVGEHTCGAGAGGYYGLHEPGCGTEPVARVADVEAALRAAQPCTCYPGGASPGDYDGPAVWCDQHGGSPSVAYEHGERAGRREAEDVARVGRQTREERVQRVMRALNPNRFVEQLGPRERGQAEAVVEALDPEQSPPSAEATQLDMDALGDLGYVALDLPAPPEPAHLEQRRHACTPSSTPWPGGRSR